MKIYGSLVVQNEADIIEELLEFLGDLHLFEKIFFFDLGSEDDTFPKALRFGRLLHHPQVLTEPYSESLRRGLLIGNRHLCHPGDWLAIIDADEFYDEDPRELIRIAEAEEADSISTFQAEFMFTDLDLARAGHEDPSSSIRKRRRHYLIDWMEPRFYRFSRVDQKTLRTFNPCSRRLMNRHYQHRTPEQMQKRIDTRIAQRKRTEHVAGGFRWPQIFSSRWNDYVIPHELCHFDDGTDLRFGFPAGVTAADYEAVSRFPHDIAQSVTRAQQTKDASSEVIEEPLVLVRLGIESTRAGVAFNEQPSGESALWVVCENASPGTVVVFDSVPLETAFGGAELLTALVAPELYEVPGPYEVHLRCPGRRSNSLEFSVT